MDFVYAYSGVWMEVMLALDMIERYILALRLERSNQRNSELFLRGNLAQMSTSHTVWTLHSLTVNTFRSNEIFSQKGHSVINTPQIRNISGQLHNTPTTTQLVPIR